MKGLTSSVDKTFAILEYFTINNPEWGVTDLAEVLGTSKSTAYRFLSDMEKRGVLQQNIENGKYSLGLKLFELGNRVQIQSAFVDKTHPELVKVSKSITETVHIAILKSNRVYYVDKVESPYGLKISSQIGVSNPAYATSLGKVLLAFTYDNLDNLFSDKNYNQKMEPFTANTITNPIKFIQELKSIRSKMYAIDNEEFEMGLICVAVPIFNKKNEIVASISAAGPSRRFKEEELESYVETLKIGADAIKESIGDFKFS